MEPRDELTGLHSRSAYLELLDQMIAKADHTPVTLIFLDLDRFMQFNQNYGHVAGDQRLRGIAEQFSQVFGQSGIVGRHGGDELAAAVNSEDIVAVYEQAEALRAKIQATAPGETVDGRAIEGPCTVTMGLASYPSDANGTADLLEKARQALYRAKEAGGNAVAFYEEKDALTGLLNRYGIQRKLDETLEQAREQRQDVSVLLVDIDEFDSINEAYGHRTGDEVLKRVATMLAANFEEEGFCGRYMGDEFLVLMPGKRADSAFILSEEVRRLIEDLPEAVSIGRSSQQVRFRISGGVATFPVDGSERVDLLRKADEALYRAKQTGRNRICLPTSAQMVTKTSHYTQTQLERLSVLAKKMDKSEAFLLREALDDLFNKYQDKPDE